jgi:hypothetical protein
MSGQVGGEHVTRIADDGSITTDFSYRDNGRGPDVKEKIILAPDGTLQRFAITGKSTFGSLVDERFERKGDRAEWSGKVDHGALKLTGKALYVPIDSTIEDTSIMLRALSTNPPRSWPAFRAASCPRSNCSMPPSRTARNRKPSRCTRCGAPTWNRTMCG